MRKRFPDLGLRGEAIRRRNGQKILDLLKGAFQGIEIPRGEATVNIEELFTAWENLPEAMRAQRLEHTRKCPDCQQDVREAHGKGLKVPASLLEAAGVKGWN